MGVVLVAHRVGQDLDRVLTGDQVAVAVQPGVDLDEGQLAVAGEDDEAGASQGDPADRLGRGGGKARDHWG